MKEYIRTGVFASNGLERASPIIALLGCKPPGGSAKPRSKQTTSYRPRGSTTSAQHGRELWWPSGTFLHLVIEGQAIEAKPLFNRRPEGLGRCCITSDLRKSR